MAECLTQKQNQEKSLAAMPVPLGEIYNWLYAELVWLQLKWSDFLKLYAAGQDRINLLNAAAPVFFQHHRQMMWEDVFLHLCRITDPIKSMGHDNLTIMRIPDAIPDPSFRATMRQLVDDAKQKSQFARDWRNRRLAHLELPILQGQLSNPLPIASRQNVEDALASVRMAMNRIERQYLNGSVYYEQSIEALGGVETLVARLTKGISAEKSRSDK